MCFLRFCLFFYILFPLTLSGLGQRVCRLEGNVIDQTSGNGVENAVVFVGNGLKKTTDSLGNFTCILPPGNYSLKIRHVSYDDIRFTLNVQKDTVLLVRLSPMFYRLRESVVIRGRQRKKGVSGLSGGRIDLNMEELKNLPKFFGTNDPLKILQLMPGVQTAGDANSGIFIRGGEPGHNLMLWNEAPVYNPSHLLGLFSVFNTGHVGSFRLHKSNMPVERGGRLSSVMEVESPDEIPDKVSVSGDIGLISSQMTLAVPLGKKSALYLSGRKTYIGLTLKPFLDMAVGGEGETPIDYEFQDYNLTYVMRPSLQDKITLNAYWGMDKLSLEEAEYALKGDMKWWNLASSLSWEHRWKEVLMKNTFFLSQYDNKLDIEQAFMTVKMPSYIRDIGFRNRFTFPVGHFGFSAGLEYLNHTISPQVPMFRLIDENWRQPDVQVYHTHEVTGYAGVRFSPLPRLMVEPGIRYTVNFQTGPYDDLTYNAQGTLLDSTHLGRGEIFGLKHGLSPRLNVRFLPDGNSSVQFSYNRQQQFVNLVSISGVGLPTDFWVPASENIPMQSGDNFSLGYFRSYADNDYELSVETYYRRMTNQMEYKNMLLDLVSQHYILEESINYGRGKAYGMEFMFKKNAGKLSGWLSYTLGWSKRYFPDIMDGEAFPAKHDRRHDLSLVAAYQLNDRWDFSSVFVYATGNAFTMPQGMYMMNGNIVKEYGKYNGARMPAYHRLDISANYWFFKKKGRESGLNFSVYNVYKRNNPLYVFLVAQPGEQNNNQIMIKQRRKKLYDIVPSISWTFKF